MDVAIKNITDEDWFAFKAESARHGLKVGEFFSQIVQEHEEKCQDSNWDSILSGEKSCANILSADDGKALRESFRKKFILRP